VTPSPDAQLAREALADDGKTREIRTGSQKWGGLVTHYETIADRRAGREPKLAAAVLRLEEENERLRGLVDSIYLRPEYDKTFGDDRECACGHPYYRHFDGYEDNAPVGCKYCPECVVWSAPPPEAQP
jgi:hypothetical protein